MHCANAPRQRQPLAATPRSYLWGLNNQRYVISQPMRWQHGSAQIPQHKACASHVLRRPRFAPGAGISSCT